jgi:amino acid transporter
VPRATTRPRNVDWKRAAALLYGDWGTSKAYVPGLAFALAAYSSFWFVLAVGLLTALVGLNYIWICKYFPDGGGVYSSAKRQSKNLALVGGFMLVADYIVTASLSCYDAFLYLGFSFEDAKRWAILAIFITGLINFLGPRHSGSIAMLLGISAVTVLGLLALSCLPHLPAAIANVRLPHGDPVHWWAAFVGVILALSGVEAIANATGVMKLDPGSTPANPSVAITSRKAIVPVMVEVCVLTVLFGLAMHAIPGLDPSAHTGDMLRYLGEVFVDEPLARLPGAAWLGEHHVFSATVGFVIACLLLSAVNTAIVDLVGVIYTMAKDNEMPPAFKMLNGFGVPWITLLVAMLAPILVIDIQSGETALHSLAEMYAIGVVGAITVNLGSTAFNREIDMRPHERRVMLFSFLVLAAVEFTIAWTKPKALLFAAIVLGLGFLARLLHVRTAAPPATTAARPPLLRMPWQRAARPDVEVDLLRERLLQRLGEKRGVRSVLLAVRAVTPVVRVAVELAQLHGASLYVLFVREVHGAGEAGFNQEDDDAAKEVFEAARLAGDGGEARAIYSVSDDPSWIILDNAVTLGVDLVVLAMSRQRFFARLVRGDTTRVLASHLPSEISLMVIAA